MGHLLGKVAKTLPFATDSDTSNFKVLSVAKVCCIIISMRCIGYARISTIEQNLDLQLNALTSAGCEAIVVDRQPTDLQAFAVGNVDARLPPARSAVSSEP